MAITPFTENLVRLDTRVGLEEPTTALCPTRTGGIGSAAALAEPTATRQTLLAALTTGAMEQARRLATVLSEKATDTYLASWAVTAATANTASPVAPTTPAMAPTAASLTNLTFADCTRQCNRLDLRNSRRRGSARSKRVCQC